jgi:hypothetical protein
MVRTETVGVDTAKELGLEVHVVEALNDLIVVGLCWRGRGGQLDGFCAAFEGRNFSGRANVPIWPSGTSSKPLSLFRAKVSRPVASGAGSGAGDAMGGRTP